MGTKLNPDRFDCYANALPDEPMFILLARDPAAPIAVASWTTARAKAIDAGDAPKADHEMIAEAHCCAMEMAEWRAANLGHWSRPQRASHSGPAGNGRIVEAYPGGWTLLERNGVRVQQHLYTGCRMAALGPDPFDPGKVVIAVEGGLAEEPGFEEDTVLFRMSPEGLEAMAATLRQAAQDARANQVAAGAAIDPRMVL